MKIISELHDAIVPSEKDIKQAIEHIGWRKIFSAITETFIEEATGKTKCPGKLIIDMPEFNNDFRAMPSYMKKYPEYIGIKVVGACRKPIENLPLVMGQYTLYDAETYKPLMICDCSILTGCRTAAASVVVIKHFVPATTNVLGLIGCGDQAIYHLEALLEDFLFDKVLVCDLSYRKMDKLVGYFPNTNFSRRSKRNIFKEAGIVVTSTPTKEPHIFPEDIPDKHMVIAAIGGDSATKLEFAPEVLEKVDYFCDSYTQAAHIGLILEAIDRGIMVEDDLKSFGDILIGKKGANYKKVKMFLSTGTALEDIALARLMYEYFKENMGGLL